jgi:hypothetical protein
VVVEYEVGYLPNASCCATPLEHCDFDTFFHKMCGGNNTANASPDHSNMFRGLGHTEIVDNFDCRINLSIKFISATELSINVTASVPGGWSSTRGDFKKKFVSNKDVSHAIVRCVERHCGC